MVDVEFNLPVPFIHKDGSVTDAYIQKYENRPWISIRSGSDHEGDSVLLHSPEHVRNMAKALLVAVDLMEKSNDV